MQKQTNEAKNKEFEELVVEVKSVTKVTKGGRNRRFSAIVVIGDRNNGVIGFVTATDLFKIKFADGTPFGVKVEE